MLETAIVGAGLCGLKLAQQLHAQGREFVLFEARNRLGGRILSAPDEQAGMALDLGPSWFWPEVQPRISRLLDELGLRSYPQHDPGDVLNLPDHDKPPEPRALPNLHGGARRVEGGMAALAQALSRDLPAASVRLDHVLTTVIDRGDHIVLRFQYGQDTTEVPARRVVLAMPPRLVEERVHFQPALDGRVREAMRETPTWMADQAKAMVRYERSFWRDAGHSGNAFVRHEHAVFEQIFDACAADGEQAALGAFFALTPEQRVAFRGGMAMLVSSQLVQVFGADAERGEQHIQDWATEPFTCSTRDLSGAGSHPERGQPVLRRVQWAGKLHFGGSETASYGGGYLEGALEAAARIQRALGESAVNAGPVPVDIPAANEASIESFRAWVDAERAVALERYRRQINQQLAGQIKEQITQRAVLNTMEQVYSEALAVIEGLTLAPAALETFEGRAALLAPFRGFNKALLDQVLRFNRGSCALSHFPEEHGVSPEYLETIARDLSAAWREFALSVDSQLMGRARPLGPVATAA